MSANFSMPGRRCSPVGMALDSLTGSASMRRQYACAAIVSTGLWPFLITLKENIMRNLSMLLPILASLTSPLAVAAEAKIDVIHPADGSRLEANAESRLDYEVTLGGGGDHAHLYVDGKETACCARKRAATPSSRWRGVIMRFAPRWSTRITRQSAWSAASRSRQSSDGLAKRSLCRHPDCP